LLVARHAHRIDTEDANWWLTSATPYDPPLLCEYSPQLSLGSSFTPPSALLFPGTAHGVDVYVHTSPFVRCVQTAYAVAREVQAAATGSVKLRMDSFLGEWLNPEYFAQGVPPPDDGHAGLRDSSAAWALAQPTKPAARLPLLDLTWPLDSFGTAGHYGERWSAMNARFAAGYARLAEHYRAVAAQTDRPVVVMFVTHGAGCSSLLAAISGSPTVEHVGLASLSVAVPRPADDVYDSDF
ncbi:uncharacterized protein V1510DRAFT_345296, partial [Dipodascopsis tothii]|uniref:uncharacterized protein n=1 Tax=Dipodascopsis tothii TaxID=44089 RepID=UPI0034CD6615